VTDVVIGNGGCSAIIVSASEDRTCKVCFTVFLGWCSREIDNQLSTFTQELYVLLPA